MNLDVAKTRNVFWELLVICQNTRDSGNLAKVKTSLLSTRLLHVREKTFLCSFNFFFTLLIHV